MGNEINTQWHPAFCSAMKLELAGNKRELEFETEHNINAKPIMIDLLVIRKSPDICIQNEIGKIFKGHNLFEYKSPGDQMGIETFLKSIGYACLYLAHADNVGNVNENDITISLVREGKPKKLIKQLIQKGFSVEEKGKGIYRVCGFQFFTIQIVVSGELDRDEHIWLKSLTKTLEKETAEKLILTIGGLSEQDERDNADAVLHVVAKENTDLFQMVKEEPKMYEALKEIMKPEIEEMIKNSEQKAMQRGMDTLSETIRRLKSGETVESISDSGINRAIIDLALSLI